MQSMVAPEQYATHTVASLVSSAPLARIAVLIPAYRPTIRMVELVRDLAPRGFGLLVVVDDGSGPNCRALFDELATISGVIVLRHAVNLGKGRALKRGFDALLQMDVAITGVVTADADGQHAAHDIERVALVLASTGPDAATAVLGCRGFDRDVPWKSRLGNSVTRGIFALVAGKRIPDTQTGLRGLPCAMLPALLTLPGERYDYEMTMLARLCREDQRPVEVPIATIYIESNRESHFHPVWDSIRIYCVLARFYTSSLLAAGLDRGASGPDSKVRSA